MEGGDHAGLGWWKKFYRGSEQGQKNLNLVYGKRDGERGDKVVRECLDEADLMGQV